MSTARCTNGLLSTRFAVDMPRIVIENLSNTVVDTATNTAAAPQASAPGMAGTTAGTLLHYLQGAGLDWMHSCGARGRCTTCKVTIVSGAENLGPYTAAEQRYRQVGQLRPHERLSCQAVVTGDVTIRVAPENKLPHVKYSS